MLGHGLGGLAQGSLDVKYLSDRYQKGLQQVANLLEKTQRFVHVDSLNLAGNDAVAQLHHGGSQS